MEHLDYDAPASLRIRKGNSEQAQTGTVAAMVTRAVELNGDPECAVLLEVDDIALGYGLIEALYQRPDFPREEPHANGWYPDGSERLKANLLPRSS